MQNENLKVSVSCGPAGLPHFQRTQRRPSGDRSARKAPQKQVRIILEAVYGVSSCVVGAYGINRVQDNEKWQSVLILKYLPWVSHRKAADQGEHFSIWHVPDTERVCACPTGGRVCGQAVRLAVIHLR